MGYHNHERMCSGRGVKGCGYVALILNNALAIRNTMALAAAVVLCTGNSMICMGRAAACIPQPLAKSGSWLPCLVAPCRNVFGVRFQRLRHRVSHLAANQLAINGVTVAGPAMITQVIS